MPLDHKIFSFFSGAGFLDLGFERQGFEIAMANEYEKKFLAAYRFAREELGIKVAADVCRPESVEVFNEPPGRAFLTRKVRLAKKDSLVGFIGGPPCPDFSVGGKNKGRDGENGKLSQTYADIIATQKPDWFLFENVKGLWKTKRHKEFYDEFKALLHSAGFITTERIVNALEFGAPQDRDRVLLFGVHKRLKKTLGLGRGKFLTPEDFDWEQFMTHDSAEKIKALNWPTTSRFGGTPRCRKGIPKELTVEHWFRKNRVDSHPNSENVFAARAGLARFQTVDEGDDSKKSYKRLHRWRYSPTAAYGNNEVHLHPYEPRRLTVSEVLAIQSLPPEFVLPPTETLSALFKMVGNGVPYLVADGLAKSVQQFFSKIHEIDSIRPGKSNRWTPEEPVLQLL